MRFIFILLLAVITSFASSAPRDLVIGGIIEQPTRFFDAENNPIGIDIDIIAAIMKKLGLSYRIVLMRSSPSLDELWQNTTQLDMVFSFSQNKEREQYLTYPTESHLNIKWNFFIRKEDDKKIRYDTFADFAHLNVGATKGFSYTDDFWAAVKNGIFKADIVEVNETQIRKLINKRIDVLPYNRFAGLYELKEMGQRDQIIYLPKALKEKDYYNTFVKKSTYPNLLALIPKYDATVKALRQDGILTQILKRWGAD